MEEFLKNFDLLPRDAMAIPLMALFFAIFWKVLGSTVIARHLALYEAREKKSVGANHQAEENFKAAAQLEAEYEARISAERSNINKSFEQKTNAARQESARIIESAEAEAAALLDSTKAEIIAEENRLAGIIEGEAEALANNISERVLA